MAARCITRRSTSLPSVAGRCAKKPRSAGQLHVMFLDMPTHPHSPLRSLDSFITGNDQVLVIKGPWGVGKTYLWNEYIQSRIAKRDLPQIAYSYVSLFGKTSLADIRASIFQSAKPISANEQIDRRFDEELKSSTSLLNRAPWVREATEKARGKAPLLGWLTNLARSTPFTDKYSGIIASLEYGLVKDYIVCFDDLERKGSALSVREVMGLADELARRKNCKVVLIFNDNSFSEEKDKREFDSYREKVVDAELDYSPTHKQNLECVIDIGHPLFSKVERLIIALDLKNIRVIQKLKRLIDTFWPELENSNELIVEEFVNHSAVLCWSYYMHGTALSFEFVRARLEESSWGSYFRGKEEEISPDERRYREIAAIVRLSPSTFDKHIVHYLKRGYANLDEARTEIAELALQIDAQHAHKELNDVWKKYSDTFADNQSEIIISFKQTLERHADKINISEFSAALDMLAELGEDVSPYVEKYVSMHTTALAAMDQHDSFVTRRIGFKPLLDRIRSIQTERSGLNIDQITMKIAVDRGWNPEDIDYLVSVTPDEFYQWIRSDPSDLPTKLQGGLLFFGDLQSSVEEDTKKFKQIFENVRIALLRLASESDLNRRRVKSIYRIHAET